MVVVWPQILDWNSSVLELSEELQDNDRNMLLVSVQQVQLRYPSDTFCESSTS